MHVQLDSHFGGGVTSHAARTRQRVRDANSGIACTKNAVNMPQHLKNANTDICRTFGRFVSYIIHHSLSNGHDVRLLCISLSWNMWVNLCSTWPLLHNVISTAISRQASYAFSIAIKLVTTTRTCVFNT